MDEKDFQKGMVDIHHKPATKRRAVARCRVDLGAKAFSALINQESPKGNVLETAKVAAIMAAKQTPQIIPMCHPLNLTKINVRFEENRAAALVDIYVEVECLGQTGVEMEALTGASVAGLTVYDMMKWADKGIALRETVLMEKSGGKSGDYQRDSGA